MNFIKKVKLRLQNSVFWKSVAALSAGQIIAQCINLFSTPVISRIYSKDAFGSFSIVISTATIIIGFIGMGLGSAIMKPEDNEESEIIFRAGFFMQFLLATALITLMFAIMPYYKFFTSSLPYPVALTVMYFYILLNVLSSYMYIYINKLKKNKVLFVNPLIGAFCTLIVTVPLGLLKMDIVGFYVAAIVSLIITNIHMFRNVNPFKKLPSFKEIFYVIKTYKDFVLYQYPSNLLGTFSGQLPNQTINSNYGSEALGDYFMSNKLFTLPSAIIAGPIQNVYFRTAAQKFRDGEDIADLTFSLISKIMVVAFFPVIFIMCFAPEIFAFVFGAEWTTAGQISSILALSYVFTFCYNCVTYCRVAIGKQKINLITTIVQLMLIFSSLLLGSLYFKTFISTIICYSIANTAWQIINLSINFFCLKKYAFKFIMFALLYCILTIGLSILINKF